MGWAPQITMQTLKVLSALLDDPAGRHYGLEVAKATGLASGTIYPILRRLEGHRWLEGAWEDIDPVAEGRRPRRYYTLTPLGEHAARRELRDAARITGAGSPAWTA